MLGDPLMQSETAKPKWIAASKIPKRFYFPAWVENTPFDEALKAFGARSFKSDLANGIERSFCLSLSSGRHAILSCHEQFPHSIQFNLEVLGGSNHRLGYVYAADMIEILQPLGIDFQPPAQITEPQWK